MSLWQKHFCGGADRKEDIKSLYFPANAISELFSHFNFGTSTGLIKVHGHAIPRQENGAVALGLVREKLSLSGVEV